MLREIFGSTHDSPNHGSAPTRIAATIVSVVYSLTLAPQVVNAYSLMHPAKAPSAGSQLCKNTSVGLSHLSDARMPLIVMELDPNKLKMNDCIDKLREVTSASTHSSASGAIEAVEALLNLVRGDHMHPMREHAIGALEPLARLLHASDTYRATSRLQYVGLLSLAFIFKNSAGEEYRDEMGAALGAAGLYELCVAAARVLDGSYSAVFPGFVCPQTKQAAKEQLVPWHLPSITL